MQVLVDADNVAPRRVQPVLDLLGTVDDAEVVISGRPQAIARLTVPAGARVLASTGWQRADVALATAYRLDEAPLVVISGDGDFGLLASRHPGAVLVVSGAPSGRLRDGTTVIDPAIDGLAPVEAWLAAQRSSGRRPPR